MMDDFMKNVVGEGLKGWGRWWIRLWRFWVKGNGTGGMDDVG